MSDNRVAKIDPRFAGLLLDAMADGVFTLDKQGRISSWNPAMERITGYKPSEAIGQSCMMLNFSRCLTKSCPGGMLECGIYQKGAVDNKECSLRHKNGQDVPILKSARIVKDKQGDVIGVVETVNDLTELQKARRAAEEANRRLAEMHRMGNIIGKSQATLQVFAGIKAAAASEATILIQGESGTGKELVAGAIHFHSERKDGPLVTVNCSALPESLLESELFGHVRGAFTGAIRDRVGRFEEAGGGTIFLDEIGEISPFIQVKLLRALQEKEIERVGESSRRKVDIRIITATNRDLYSRVQEGHFREDLYYRLKVFPIHVPPLRERREDIVLLVNHFIDSQNKKTGKHIRRLSEAAMRILLDYNWPGNVRELENAIEHAFVLCAGDEIDVFDLPVEIRRMEYQPMAASRPASPSQPLPRRSQLTRSLLMDLLESCEWNKAEVARQVGMSRTAIWKYMKKWNIPLKREKSE